MRLNPFTIGALCFALVALIATGFPEDRRESLTAAAVFIGIAVLIEVGGRVLAWMISRGGDK